MKRILKLAQGRRSFQQDALLGIFCAFVAGAINAGGFVIVGQYTSHVTGMTARLSDGIGLHQTQGLVWIVLGLLAFLSGAVWSSILIQIASFWRLRSRYALALLGSGMTLILLSFYSSFYHGVWQKQFLSLGFFFSMGMQNATVSKLTNFQIRATHMTGIVTDIGIELGRYLLRSSQKNIRKLKVLASIFCAFLIGGILGAILFSSILKSWSLLIFGGVLLLISWFPIWQDTSVFWRWSKK